MSMLLELPEVKYIYPANPDAGGISNSADAPFSEEVIAFLHELSGRLGADVRTKEFADVASFAFYCRRGNTQRLRDAYAATGETRLGRGLVFHIAPSNVAVNFAYSLVAGLLAGNTNVVKIPSKHFEQTDIIGSALKVAGSKPEFSHVARRIMLLQYPRDSKATELLSAKSDVRVIWGGDETVKKIREVPIPAHSSEITFADRYSLAVIDAGVYMQCTDKCKVAQGFYNDTYISHQSACTAPHLVIWIGSPSTIDHARMEFWSALQTIVVEKRWLADDINSVDKLTSFCSQAIDYGVTGGAFAGKNDIWNACLSALPKPLENCRVGNGYFFEYKTDTLAPLVEFITDRFQSLVYFGMEKSVLRDFVIRNRLRGIDRIIPIGRSMEFSLNWDGYDLVRALSRRCDIL